MSQSPPQEPVPSKSRLRVRAEHSLNELVMLIEFTLISVMAGVVLAPLADTAKDLLRDLRFEFWPYILFGMLYILLMWSGVIGHSFTFIGWPFELGHNLFYFAWALVLAMQMTFLADPVAWFAMNCVQYLVTGGVAFYDLRILRRREREHSGAAKTLIDMAILRQVQLVRLVPMTVGVSILSLALLLVFPGIFLDQHAHWVLGLFQIGIAAGGLSYNIRSLILWQDAIVKKAMAELSEEETGAP